MVTIRLSSEQRSKLLAQSSLTRTLLDSRLDHGIWMRNLNKSCRQFEEGLREKTGVIDLDMLVFKPAHLLLNNAYQIYRDTVFVNTRLVSKALVGSGFQLGEERALAGFLSEITDQLVKRRIIRTPSEIGISNNLQNGILTALYFGYYYKSYVDRLSPFSNFVEGLDFEK